MEVKEKNSLCKSNVLYCQSIKRSGFSASNPFRMRHTNRAKRNSTHTYLQKSRGQCYEAQRVLGSTGLCHFQGGLGKLDCTLEAFCKNRPENVPKGLLEERDLNLTGSAVLIYFLILNTYSLLYLIL